MSSEEIPISVCLEKEYDEQHYTVNVDNTNGLPYVFHNGRKLYFKRDMLAFTEVAYRGLLIEQDKRSAHRYVDSYEELKGKTLLDIGAVEAIFTLDTIEYIIMPIFLNVTKVGLRHWKLRLLPIKKK